MATTTRRVGLLVATMVLAACGQRATVEGIELSPPSSQVARGLGLELTVTAHFSDGTRRDVTAEAAFSSSDQAVASVAAGRVQGQGPGLATVFASWGSGQAAAAITVTDATLLSLEVASGQDLTLPKGTSVRLQATGRLSDGTSQDLTSIATWSCPEGTLEFQQAGLALGALVGHGTARASVGGRSSSLDLEVTDAAVVAVRVVTASDRLPVGVAARVTAMASFTDGTERDVSANSTFATTNVGVLRMAPDHTVRAMNVGDAFVAATFARHTGQLRLSVTPAEMVGLRIDPEAATVLAGATTPFQAYGTFTDGSEIEVTSQVVWRAPETGVAALSNAPGAEGLAYGLAPGDVAVTASLPGSAVAASAQLTVEPPALVAVVLSTKRLSIGMGETYRLVATGTFSDGSTSDVSAAMAWEPMDGGVVTVQAGLVTAIGPGHISIMVYEPSTFTMVNFVGVAVDH